MPEEEVAPDAADAMDAKSQASEEVSPAEATSSVAAAVIESPPAAAQPLNENDAAPRARLHQLATDLVRNRNRRLLVEFLQLRRALR